jgi:hypothetical protein
MSKADLRNDLHEDCWQIKLSLVKLAASKCQNFALQEQFSKDLTDVSMSEKKNVINDGADATHQFLGSPVRPYILGVYILSIHC